MRSFDVVVLGGGPAGEVAAKRLGDAGLEVALVEDRLVGGECAYWACLPSKGLLRPYEALAEARRVAGAAEAASGELDVPAVLRRRDEIIGGLDDAAQLPFIRSAGVELVRGRGRLAGERRVVVGDEELEARRAVVLAGGSEPAFPPIEGLDGVEGAWSNREATTAQAIPPRLIVLGGGPVGVELAQAFQTLGSRVTLIEGERRILPLQEQFACTQVEAALQSYGVDVRIGANAVGVEQREGLVTVTTDDGGMADAEVLLVALGRRAPTTDVGVEHAGLDPGGFVPTDEHLRVPGVDWLYAIGDINGRAKLTHMGKYHGRLAADCILGRPYALSRLADGLLSPQVIFTDPQVAAVGHTTDTARAAGIDFDVYETETQGNDGGEYYGHGAPGTTRFLVDRDRRVLIGFTITGPDVADFLHAATIAVVGEVPLDRLRHAVPPFPTRSEIWLALLEQAGV